MNQQRRRFAKSARHHAGLLENQADTIESPSQQTAEEPNEDSDAESSSQASPPVVSDIAGYAATTPLRWRPTTGVFRGVDCRVQRRGWAIKAEKERKKRLAIEAALA